MLTAYDIRTQLRLPNGEATEACAERLCARKLTVAPVLEPLLVSALVGDAGRDQILAVLRLFRASVRGLDDLLDASATEPDGTPAAWVVHGRGTTAATAVVLWERAVSLAQGEARCVLLTESRAMLAAANLEEHAQNVVRAGHESTLRSLGELELRLRDKEIAYWRLIAGLMKSRWRGTASSIASSPRS